MPRIAARQSLLITLTVTEGYMMAMEELGRGIG